MSETCLLAPSFSTFRIICFACCFVHVLKCVALNVMQPLVHVDLWFLPCSISLLLLSVLFIISLIVYYKCDCSCGDLQVLTVWAYPQKSQHFRDAVVCCIRHNSDPIVLPVSCHGVEPELKIDKKNLDFKRVLLRRCVVEHGYI